MLKFLLQLFMLQYSVKNNNQINLYVVFYSNLLEEVKSKYSPSFFHLTTGGGCPFGGEHFNMVSSPIATSVSFGIALKSSRRSKSI